MGRTGASEEETLLLSTSGHDDEETATDLEQLTAQEGEQRTLGITARLKRAYWIIPLAAAALCGLAAHRLVFGDSAGQARLEPRHEAKAAAIVNLDADCHTTSAGEKCFDSVQWAKTQGIYSNPDWYEGLSANNSIGEFQAAVHKSAPEKCPMPCLGGNKGGSKKKCIPPQVEDKYGACNPAQGPAKMTFYMYRAQGPEEYPVVNVNMASLAGVMWYLHREVVGSKPRKFHIERIIRYKVTMENTKEYYDDMHKQFGPFVAFDAGSATGRSDTWKKWGFVVGCQLVNTKKFAYVPPEEEQPSCYPKDSPICRSGKWYSLPGPCPEMKVPNKTKECTAKWPGGCCSSALVTGKKDCTYWTEFAGQIKLDELEGIDDYSTWWLSKDDKGGEIPNGNVEYDWRKDRGIGMTFWDYGHDEKACAKRMDKVKALFKKYYPDQPTMLPEPPCI